MSILFSSGVSQYLHDVVTLISLLYIRGGDDAVRMMEQCMAILMRPSSTNGISAII